MPKPDIVVTSYEAAAADAPALKAISWEVVLLDERQRGRAGLAKVLNYVDIRIFTYTYKLELQCV